MARIGSLHILSDGITFLELLLGKLGAQTANAVPFGQGINNPLGWTPPLAAGQFLVGTSTTTPPILKSLVGAGGISIINGPSTITISGSSSGFSWTVVSGGVTPMFPANGYIVTTAPSTLQLPAAGSGTPGDSFQIVGDGQMWVMQTNGNTVHLCDSTATMTLSSTGNYDTITLVCVDASTYVVTATQGNIKID